MADALHQWACQILGRCEVAGDCSWQHRMSRVVRLRGPDGGQWIVKQHRDTDRYRAELGAYQRWVPALGGRAPMLRAHDDGFGAILISAVAGKLAIWPAPARPPGGMGQAAELAVHRDAGVALRLLHDAQPPQPCPDLGAVKTGELDQLAPDAAGLLSGRELAFAACEAAALTAIGPTGLVPCHGDYTPRNWLTGNGTVRVIDFEWARLDAAPADLARLHLAIWQARPDLRASFLDGYGRPLDDKASAALRGCAAVMAIWLTVKARQSGQPSFEQASRAALRRLMTSPPCSTCPA
jgi:hypothetical protein